MVRASIALIFLGLAAGARADGESRRLFDFAPVSILNPVVATIDGRIEIPLSELRAYRAAEHNLSVTEQGNLGQKRAILDALIDQYLYVDECYRTGVTQNPGFLKEMEATRTLILTDLVTPQDPKEAMKMGDRLFEQADELISNEAWALLKKAALAVDKNRSAERRDYLARLLKSIPDAELVRCGKHSLKVQNVAVIYAGMSAPRPDLQTQAGVIQMIKPLLIPELMADEAERQGIASRPAFQQQLDRNRNALLRFHVQGEIEHEANRLMADDHSSPEVKAERSVRLLEELMGQKARALRKEHHVAVNDAVLAGL